MKKIEKYIREHCNIEFHKTTGEEIVNSSLASVIIALEEYGKDLKSSLEYDDFGFGDPSGDVSDNKTECQTGFCNFRRPDKSI